jgi:hypothetical protein
MGSGYSGPRGFHRGSDTMTLAVHAAMIEATFKPPGIVTGTLGTAHRKVANCTACGKEVVVTRLRGRKGDRLGRYCSVCL